MAVVVVNSYCNLCCTTLRETVGVVMHKDSAWQSQWKNFKDNNKVVNGLFNLRLRFEESENVFVRAFRSLADSISEKIGLFFCFGLAY